MGQSRRHADVVGVVGKEVLFVSITGVGTGPVRSLFMILHSAFIILHSAFIILHS